MSVPEEDPIWPPDRRGPDFEVRGVMLDVSRTRVPTMATLLALVDRLAQWKINQLQLYMEHVFAYVGHETVWMDSSPFTPNEIRSLDTHCARHGIELVPNQQSFGHMHRWLKHAKYRDLAEVPEGLQHAFSTQPEPYSLDLSNPRALALLDDLYDQLLPCFTSRQFNVGCDETFDLGLGKSKARCLENGTARVYLDYLLAIHRKVVARGKRMQFWGDIVLQHPELVAALPKDMIALAWGYDAGHPFAANTKQFAESGLAFYVCPGTSSWQSIAGRTTNMLANLSEASRHGRASGATGYLVTDWGDRGHLQPHLVTEVGLFTAAAFAWDSTIDLGRERLARAIDRHLFLDDAGVMGRLVLELGDAYLETDCGSTNGSALFFLLAFAGEPLPHARLPGLNAVGLERARAFLLARRPSIETIRSRRNDAQLLMEELRWMIDVLVFACDFGLARLGTSAGESASAIQPAVRSKLAARLRPLISEHRRLWLLRDRPGGLDESAGWLERPLDLLTL
jgi:hexosaminidase